MNPVHVYICLCGCICKYVCICMYMQVTCVLTECYILFIFSNSKDNNSPTESCTVSLIN